MHQQIVVPHDTHPLLLLEPPADSVDDAVLSERQRCALALAGDEVAEGRMRGEVTAAQEAFNAVRAYVGYMHATDDDPTVTTDHRVSEDDVLAAVVGHPPAGITDDDVWSLYIDPVPALVAEIRRLLKILELR